MGFNEAHWTSALQGGDEKVFEDTYKQYARPLICYAYTIVKDQVAAEEIVQNVFLRIWEKKAQRDIHTSLNAYLYKAVYFESLNFLKHETVQSAYLHHSVHAMKHTNAPSASESLHHRDLEGRLRKALSELPEQCRTVFQLSRFEELKYREIADRLGIAEKTVENHMGKALKLLRLKLADFITIIAITIIHLKNMLP